jgi:hypothetical protein
MFDNSTMSAKSATPTHTPPERQTVLLHRLLGELAVTLKGVH